MNRVIKNTGFYLLIFLVIIGIVHFITNQGEQLNHVNYNEFRSELAQGNVDQVLIRYEGFSYIIEGRYVIPRDDRLSFVTRAPFDPRVVELLETSGVTVEEWEKAEGTSGWITFFSTIIPFLLIFILFFFLLNQSQGGGGKVMNFGKSKAKLYTEEKKKVNFKDVAGADEEKQELIEVVEFLKDPRKFSSVGARIPKGVLLVGPPGTGKTLLARAVAGEAGVPFFSISGSDFVEMFVGVGASRVRDLFENAKKNAPCIIFIDEIDAVGRQRGAGLGGGHDEREQTLNQLLVEMDGFGVNEGIIMIAATNRADILDPALLRPGRFDRQITVDRPDVKGRQEVLQVHSRNKPLADDVDLQIIARRTTGFTGADLENLMNEAALLTARRGGKVITMNDVDGAIDRVLVGTEKRSKVVSDQEKRTVAYHEAGHAVVGFFLEHADTVHKVTIIPRGRAGGYAVMLPKEDRMMLTKNELLDRVTGLLGGRVAEELFIGEIATGAYSDFKHATSIVRAMIMEYGMSDKLGPMQFGTSQQGQVFLGRDIGHEQNYSDSIAYEIDQEMQNFTRACYERCRALLTEHKDAVELIAQTLLAQETLDEGEIRSLLTHGKLPDPPEPPAEPEEEPKAAPGVDGDTVTGESDQAGSDSPDSSSESTDDTSKASETDEIDETDVSDQSDTDSNDPPKNDESQ